MKNKSNVLRQVGSSAHAKEEREYHDYYATHPMAVEYLLKELKKLNIQLTDTILEPCVGAGHIAYALEDHNYKIEAYDIVNRGYPNTKVIDFLIKEKAIDIDVITNPLLRKETISFYIY